MSAERVVTWDETLFALPKNVLHDFFCLDFIWRAQVDCNSFGFLVLGMANHLHGKLMKSADEKFTKRSTYFILNKHAAAVK